MGNQFLSFFSSSHAMCIPQDVLTDLSAECENLPVEGVSGACYAHKVRLAKPRLCRGLIQIQVCVFFNR